MTIYVIKQHKLRIIGDKIVIYHVENKNLTNKWPVQVYFDCNATTPVLLGAAKAAVDTMEACYGNPSSSHSIGLQARHILESTRKVAARVVEADPEQIIFTSGATEAIQMAIFSVLKACKDQIGISKTKLLYGATEHKAVAQALHHWTNVLDLPYEIVELPVDSNGQIVMESLLQELPHAALLCTMAVNNETGVIQNLLAIENALVSISSKIYWLVDCVQALGKLDLKLNSSRIDYAAFSGHKFYAPKGTGFLYKKNDAPITPLIVGGGQEKNFRSGTENLPGIAALGFVLKQLQSENSEVSFQLNDQLVVFRDKLVSVLKEIFPGIIFNTPLAQSVPTTLNFSVPGLSSGELLDLFDAGGLHLSGGSACSSGSLKSSHVLDAMGIAQYISTSAVRLSFGPCTTLDEIDQACDILRKCGAALNKACLLDSNIAIEKSDELQDGVLQFRIGAANTWMIVNRASRNCIIIDPCEEVAERITHYVQCQNLMVLAVLDTHGHADHESIRPLLQKTLAPHFSSDNNQFCSPLGWPEGNANSTCMVTLDNSYVVPALRISSTVHGELVLARIGTPGHTDDSQTFLLGIQKSGYLNKADVHFVFSGDMILSGGLGRTNFSTSSTSAMYYSLRKLYSVVSPYALMCPAHDYNQSFCTNFHTEIKLNPLMRLALNSDLGVNLSEFINKKSIIDDELVELEKNFHGVVCGVTNSIRSREDLAMMIHPSEVKNRLYDKETLPLVIDVSENKNLF